MDTSQKKPPDPIVLDKSWINDSRHASSLFWNSSNVLNSNFNPIKNNSWFSIKKLTHNDSSCQFNENNRDLKTILEKAKLEEKVQKIRKATGFTKAKAARQTKAKKEAPNRIRIVRIYTSSNNKKILNKWFGCARKTYNWALGSIKKHLANPKMRYMTNFMWLRNRFVNANNIPKNLIYLLDCSKEVRANALKDLANALSINFQKCKDDKEFKFQMRFRSKSDEQSIKFGPNEAHVKNWNIPKLDSNNKNKSYNVSFNMFPTKLKDSFYFKVRARDIKKNKALEVPIRECTLVKNKLGQLFLHVPVYLEHSKPVHESQEWCAIDPGVRSLMTIYSPNKEKCFKVANTDISKIYRHCLQVDKLVSNGTKAKGKAKKKIKKHELKLRKRIRNLANEVHWKTINFLTDNFTHIIYPTYNTGNMIKSTNRIISTKSVRQMVSWRNYSLKQKLIERCKQKGVELIQCTEEYTSKTCSNCGHIHKSLKDKKIYTCKECNLNLDRDLNAARNIFMKNIYKRITF